VPVGNGVLVVAGTPVYAASEAVHDGMGWLCPIADGGGCLIYPNPNPTLSSTTITTA